MPRKFHFKNAKLKSSELEQDKEKKSENQPNNPLHGITLAHILNHLVAEYGWDELGSQIDIRCFNHNPSVKSSLKFLRKTPWAREKVEKLYLKSV